MPNWTKLGTYHDKKWKSFEELCYQLAYRLYSSRGELSRIDDSGGGDGVEFYVSFPNGAEWGWQAKYYLPGSRLHQKNRKRHVVQSFKRSVKLHPKLTKWILCTPMVFTSDEIHWFNSKLRGINSKVKLERWDESRVDTFLADPRMVGIRTFFFGELEFTPDRFKLQVEGQLKALQDKFTPALHTEGEADLQAHALIADERLLVHLNQLCGTIEGHFPEFERAAEDARESHVDKGWETEFNTATRLTAEVKASLSRAFRVLQGLVRLIQEGRSPEIRLEELTGLINELDTKTVDQLQSVRKWDERFAQTMNSQKEEEAKKSKDRFHSLTRRVSAPSETVREILSVLSEASYYLSKSVQPYVHFLGDPGLGKTHLMCNLCSKRVQSGLPAILLLGKRFSIDRDVKKEILEFCDIPSSYSFHDFLSALDSYAFSRRTKVVIAIDALNESKDPDIWATQLGGIESAIQGLERVVLITTCRSSYQPAIWKGDRPSNLAFVRGFVAENLDQALEAYFNYYKIRATLTFSSSEQFKNPLYLRIFCESENPERAAEKVVHVGDQTFLQVFEAFLRKVNERVSTRLSKPPRANLVQKRLMNLGRYLWAQNARHAKFDNAVELIENRKVDDVDWEKSFSNILEDEGLLVTRDWVSERTGQYVSFTYDLLGGYLITKACLDSLDKAGIEGFVTSEEFKTRLVGDDYKVLHPLREDILRCMCVLLPARGGVYLHQHSRNRRAFAFAIHALFEMEPRYVRKQETATLSHLFNIPENRKALLAEARSTAFNPLHPLNWQFWNSLLNRLTIAERDVGWTEHLREDTSAIAKVISGVEQKCIENTSFTLVEKQRLRLAAEYLQWVLTSTNHRLRDLSTRGLYWFGRRFPRDLFSMTLESLQVNDPYVPERMLAASYGVAMALYKAKELSEFGQRTLPDYGRSLYGAMFAKGAKFATTHALMRDYAKHTIDISLLQHPDLLVEQERRRIEPPFHDGGIRRLRKGQDRNPGEYRDGNSPLGMDFHNYTLGTLVRGRENYDFTNTSFKNVESHVWWRIYNLGYSLERFGEIDKRIAGDSWRFNRNEENTFRTDRYGKKYAWVAFYELYGLFQDKGILEQNWANDEGRPSDVDIEPSFPNPPHSVRVVTESFLGPANLAPKTWVKCGPVPDLSAYLVMQEVDAERGPWVLLEGTVHEEDETIGHRISIGLMALLIDVGSVDQLTKLVRTKKSEGYWLPRTPESYYSFVGEVPWCESIPHNGTLELEFVVSIERRKETPQEVKERVKGNTLLDAMMLTYGLKTDATGEMEKVTRQKRSRPLTREVPLVAKIPVTVPTLHMAWESYHTITTPHQGDVVAKDIASALGLWVRLPSMDMYDPEGRRAAITTRWGEPWKTNQRFVFLRKDLFDKFLEMKGLTCVWGLWGQRDYPLKLYHLTPTGQKQGLRWVEFKDLYSHKP